MAVDFHVYPDPAKLSICIAKDDPQKDQVLQAISDVMNQAERAREADECLDAKGW